MSRRRVEPAVGWQLARRTIFDDPQMVRLRLGSMERQPEPGPGSDSGRFEHPVMPGRLVTLR
jgi:hypothetical protein